MADECTFADRQFELAEEFAKLLLEHPEMDASIPDGAAVYFEIAGEDEFNLKSRELAARDRACGQSVVFVRIEGVRPPEGSRLISPKIVEFSDAA